MKRTTLLTFIRLFFTVILYLLVAVGHPADAPPFAFSDVTAEVGLASALREISAHAAAWGDIGADGWPDLYVGVFVKPDEQQCNLLLRNHGGRFSLDEQPVLRVQGRTSGAVFADFDADGDLELFVSNDAGRRSGVEGARSRFFRGEADGKFVDITDLAGACPERVGGRSVAVLDFNGDARLDLLVAEDPWTRRRHNRIYQNLGGLRFAERVSEVGLPARMPGLGVAVADVDGDSWPDFFVASRGGGNRLFLNDAGGRFRQARFEPNPFHWETVEHLDTPAGACFGDLNRDGRPDLVVGQHYRKPWRHPQPLRVFLNLLDANAKLQFKEVTAEAGLAPLRIKAPHVEIQDLNNDGWPEIIGSTVKYSADGKVHPLIYWHRGLRGGIPVFETVGLDVNAYPTVADCAIDDSDTFYAKMVKDRLVTYFATGPTADYNRDGRLDIFVASWWKELPSHLLRNDTPGGHWLQVEVAPIDGTAPMGIGAKISVYLAGGLGKPEALLGCREIAVGYGYSSGQTPVAHFGLGAAQTCDVQVVYPAGKGSKSWPGITADRRVRLGPAGVESRPPVNN